jgi:hypothetical protein
VARHLGFHGDPGVIYLGDGRKRANTISLEDLEERLAGKCHRRIIHFGTCATLDVNGHRLNRFLRNTGALAVTGYREYVYWLSSAAFEILVFGAMQDNSLTRLGAKAMRNSILKESPYLARKLGFRMVVRSS